MDVHGSFLDQAVRLAVTHMEAGEGGPFGAVLCRDGVVIAEGWNQVLATCDPTAHAEVVAIRRASQSLGTFDLRGTVLYASAEPCPMCLAAALWARVDCIYYAADRSLAAGAGFDDAAFYDEIARPEPDRQILPVRHYPISGASTPFDLWNAREERTPY